MKKALFAVAAAILILLGFAAIGGEAILLKLRAAQTEKTSLADLQRLLEPNIIIKKPAGDGPFPVVVQFHGCAGARLPFQEMWADVANKNGYMAVIVDSLRPRKVGRTEAVETVCRGQKLLGLERAGDVVAALDKIRARNDVDTDNIILTGWSHGAWTIMDFLTMDLKKDLPASLASYDGELPKIKGSILFYPYCGIGTLTRIRKWEQSPKVLALIAGADSVVNHKECLNALNKLQKNGVSVEQKIYPDTEHAFDDPFIEAEWKHWHSPDNLRDALARYEGFLTRLK